MGYRTDIDAKLALSRPPAGAELDQLLAEYAAFAAGSPGAPEGPCDWDLMREADTGNLFADPNAVTLEINTDKPAEWEEWLAHLLREFFTPRGLQVSGTAHWRGDDDTDFGYVQVENNEMTVYEGRITYQPMRHYPAVVDDGQA